MTKSHKEIAKELDAERAVLAQEIGFLVLEWNALQEELVAIFSVLLTGNSVGRPQAVWHSTPNDRAQREMLRGAINFRGLRNPPSDDSIEAVNWLLKETDILANQRNDVIHSPFIRMFDKHGGRIMPNTMHGNPRAKQLEKKEQLLSEIRWYRAKAQTLANYAFKLFFHFFDQSALPKKPQLPHRGQDENRD
jgi:hypothetical protein